MRPLALLGAVVAIFGFVILFQRGLAGVFDFTDTAVTLVGVLALVQGVRYGLARRGADRPTVELGDPETRYEVPTPGSDLDERLRRSRSVSHVSTSRRRRVRDRVRTIAIETLTASSGLSTARAHQRIDDGDWPADPIARAFLSQSDRYPITMHVRARVTGESTFGFGLRRAIEAIESAESIDDDENRSAGSTATEAQDTSEGSP